MTVFSPDLSSARNLATASSNASIVTSNAAMARATTSSARACSSLIIVVIRNCPRAN